MTTPDTQIASAIATSDMATTGVFARLAQGSTLLGGSALIGMAMVEAWQVFARYVLNDSPGWTEPLALLLLNAAMSFGAAVAVRQGAHFGFFILRERAPHGWRRALEWFSALTVAALGVVIAIWGTRLFVDGLQIRMAGTWLAQSAAYLPMSIGGGLMALFSIERAWRRPRAATTTEAG